MTNSDSSTSRFSNLSEAKLALLNKRMKQNEHKSAQSASSPSPKRTEKPLKLSSAQLRLWFMNQYSEQAADYNMCAALSMKGKLDIDALERSIASIVQRHEVLRTSFYEREGEPFQQINDIQTIHLEKVDLHSLQEDRLQHALELAREDAKTPFDLKSAPLLRTKLFIIKQNEYVFYINMHHIVSDGWSTSIFIKELAEFYKQEVMQKELQLPALPIQYADYAIEEQQLLQSSSYKLQLDYWKKQLEGPLPVLKLPFEKPIGAKVKHSGNQIEFIVSQQMTKRIREVCQSEGITMFMALVASFKALLFRYTDQEDILIGTPVANRQEYKTENLIGFFANTLTLRTRIDGERPFTELLKQIKESSLDAFSNQEVPFEKLLEELNITRSLQYTPLFQTMFVLQNTPQTKLSLPELEIEFQNIYNGTFKYNIVLSVAEEVDFLKGTIEYNQSIFDDSTMERMVEHFQVLLDSLFNNVQLPINQAQLVNATEQQWIMESFSHKKMNADEDTNIITSFERQVALQPDAVAVIYEDTSLTYRELNTRSNQLAHYLLNKGVKNEQYIGLFMERSLNMIIGMIGILKAGAVYVPLDPMQPTERLHYVIEDTQLQWIVSERQLSSTRSEFKQVWIEVDDKALLDQAQWEKNPNTVINKEQLAYIIYTSGSTGKPKGVMVEHRNISRLFSSTEQQYQFNDNDVWTLFHSYTFDFSVWEIWGALLYGGRLVIVPYWQSRSPHDFYETVVKHGVTVLNQTPSAFRQFMTIDKNRPVGSLQLRYIIFGGEALDLPMLRPWCDKHGDHTPQLINMYGITETTVHTTIRRLTMADILHGHGSIIGTPLLDLEVYVLDNYLNVVPVEISGEMYIGGAGVTRGYWNRNELTAERFIDSPFDNTQKLYKSGDLGRFLPTGDLEYMGRIDHQVKIYGFRIELGEIESVIAQYPNVDKAIVIMKEVDDFKQLEAYVTQLEDQKMDYHSLRTHLLNVLPEYMVPAAFYVVKEIPLTHNGKIDQSKLQTLENEPIVEENQYIAPSTEQEKALCSIWERVLNNSPIGVNDNYFALGGDSIKAIKVKSEAEKGGITFSIQQLFEFQTVRTLAEQCHTLVTERIIPANKQPFELVTQEDQAKLPSHVVDAFPLSRLQVGMLFHTELEKHDTGVYHNISSIMLEGLFNEIAFRKALEQLVKRHPILRTSFDLYTYTVPLQLVHTNNQVSLSIMDLRLRNNFEQQEILQQWYKEEQQNYFNYDAAHLFRMNIHLLTKSTFQFSLTEHHSILDGWSVASLLTELFEGYVYYLNHNQLIERAQLNMSYYDYVKLEREEIRSEHSLNYWKHKLVNASLSTLSDWGQYPSGNTTSQQAMNKLQYTLPAKLYEEIKHVANLLSVSFKNVLLTSHVAVISKLCSQRDVITGVVTNGRLEEEEGEQVLGLFLNTLPFRVEITGLSWTELARKVFDTEKEIWPYRRLPLNEIQKGTAEGNMLFDHAFNFTDFHVYKLLQQSEDLKVLGYNDTAYTNFNLMTHFNLDPVSSQLDMIIEYNTKYFDPSQIDDCIQYYVRALTAMTHNPNQLCTRWDTITTQETLQRIAQWNATDRNYAAPDTLIELIEYQVERSPDAIAVRFEERELTYHQLDQQANQLAKTLQQQGACVDTFVGLCTERSVDMMIGLLAILKAGAAYVPLDPSYPKERLAFMLADAQVPILLTQSHLVPQLPEHQAALILLDQLPTMTVDTAPVRREGITPDAAAYMIYTSGSTGRPKGVVNIQRAIINRLLWMQETYQLEATDRVLQKTPISFDVSVWELFWPLLAGAQLVIARPDGHKDPDYLVQIIQEQQITTLHFVPSMLRLFMEQPQVSTCTSLRRVICSGEALPYELQERWFTQLPSTALWNLYGPTEAAIDVTSWKCEPGARRTNVPIGRPIANTQVYILNEELEPVPIGATGELYIGGVQLAREYYRRPELTAEQFIPNPFTVEPGARLYKTGDLARYEADGTIEYKGRIDDQIKLRGFRIELGEIEAVLLEHPGVRAGAMGVQVDAQGYQVLLGYWIPTEGYAGRSRELRKDLLDKLPEYMVPARWTEVEAIPLTPSGKIDRKKLLDMTDWTAEPDRQYVAPSSPLEQAMANIWSDVLGVEEIGVNDNFFVLGGDSIRSISVLAKARHQGINIELQQLFKYPTISSLINEINNGERISSQISDTIPFGLLAEEDVALITASEVEDAYPLTALQSGLVFHSKLRPNTAIYHDIMSFKINGEFIQTAFAKALQRVIQRHSILRTTFDLIHFSEPMQLVHRHVEGNVFIRDLGVYDKEKQNSMLQQFKQQEQQLEFDWTQPLVRFFVHILDRSTYHFTLSFHDSMLDGWSVNSLITELFSEYNQLVHDPHFMGAGKKAVPFRQYIALERNSYSAESKAYWQKTLTDFSVNKVPKTLMNSAIHQDINIQYFKVPLSTMLSDQLKACANQLGVPIKSVLLAAHLRVLGLISGSEDVLTGLEHNGRPEVDGGSEMLGLFLNTVPMRLELNLQHGTWRWLIHEVYKAEIELLPHRRYPLAQLQKDFGGSPLFETVFNYTHFHVADKLLTMTDLNLIDTETTLETDFPLRAEFSRDLTTDHLTFELHYDRYVLSEQKIKEIGMYYTNVFQKMVADPDEPYMKQSLLAEDEIHKLLYERNKIALSNDSSVQYRSFIEGFEQRVRLAPHHIAVSYKDRQLTYTQLAELSNQIATRLAAYKTGAEVMVAILADRSIDFLASMLAIFKCGFVYVPLDPRYPSSRIEEMINISDTQLIIYEQHYENLLPVASEVNAHHMLKLDDLCMASSEKYNVSTVNHARDLAYIIFTSGSTGKPKGVMVEHQGMINHLNAKIQDLTIKEHDVIAQNASQCFDISVWQFLAGLLVGARVHICENETIYNAVKMFEVIQKEQVTILEMVPSVIRTMLEQINDRAEVPSLETLRWLIPTGEALSPKLVEQWLGHYPAVPLLNAYGPTECSDDVTHYAIQSMDDIPFSHVPIGRPICNMQMYILDAYHNLVPDGVAGELYISGIGVGRGYINNPLKTAESFLNNPFSDLLYTKMYKSGDLVRYLENGNIEFLGRMDHQVKIRGHRIELGEIETVLLKHPLVQEAVVISAQSDLGDDFLIGYWIGKEDELSERELRLYLKKLLPDYCIPSYLMAIDKMPLTINGKIDRKALPAVKQMKPVFASDKTSPADRIQHTLFTIWSEVLKSQDMGIHDHFFEIGGDSLKLMHIHSKIENKFNCTVSVVELFDHPTIHSLALLLKSKLGSEESELDHELNETFKRAEQRKEWMKRRRTKR